MKQVLYILLLLPLMAHAGTADSLHAHRKPEGYVEIGYASEQWILSANLPNGYSGVTYGGKGIFLGGGFRSRLTARRPLGFDLGINYLSYSMDKTLKENEHVQTGYSYGRLSPGAIYAFKTKSAVSFMAGANVSILVPLQGNEQSYFQFGIKGVLGYDAYGLILGYNFSKSSNTPSTEIATGTWHEHSVVLGIMCYPSRFKKKSIKIN